MFNWFGNEAYKFERNNYTYNSHTWSINPKKFKTDEGLREMFKVTSISYMPTDGRPFVASIESDKYPFFGTQFHPEKVTTIYSEGNGINHSLESISLNRHFADYFVYLTRHNTNYYGDFKEV